jgi:hypothetical protein
MLKPAAVLSAILALFALGTTAAWADRCPSGYHENAAGTCVKLVIMQLQCPTNSTVVDGKCKCNLPLIMINGKCSIIPPLCPPGLQLVNGKCVPKCPPGKHLVNGICMTDLH